MNALRLLTAVDQTVGHLRDGIRSGRWKKQLPGERTLAAELGVARKTVRAALHRLETETLLAPGGMNGVRRILVSDTEAVAGPRSLRVGILLMEPLENQPGASQLAVSRVLGALQGAGHTCRLAHLPALADPGKTGALSRLVATIGADAWVVFRGTLEVLTWFAAGPVPVIALGGRSRALPIAFIGYNPAPMVREAVRRLVALGHRRIVYICRRSDRLPVPSLTVTAFREELASAGVRPGDYNTPDWEETPAGLEALLHSLFRLTPPTALLFVDAPYSMGAIAFLGRRGVRVPEDVSLVSLAEESSLLWVHPGLIPAHVEGDEYRESRHIVRWVDGVAAGTPSIDHADIPVVFNPGNSLGPAKA